MVELKIPPRPNLRPWVRSKEFMAWPGRNSPDLGRWLAETYTKPGDWIIDPMCGVGQMWLSAPLTRHYSLRDADPAAALVPLRHSYILTANAETFKPSAIDGRLAHLKLVAFSPPYPQAHNAGATAHQIRMRDEKGDHAIQGFSGPPPDMPKVYANIASWGHHRLAVVVRNSIVDGEETDWVQDNAEMILGAGYQRVDTFWRRVYPTRWQQAKLKRDPSTAVIDREYILVATR